MSDQIDAIFDQGVFRPLVPPALPDQARVKLTVESASPADSSTAPSTDFDAELEPLLFDGPNLPADFSRADIYSDHD
jgi:predicted DNA-binding antitoxin AbrB/MazE fold protein